MFSAVISEHFSKNRVITSVVAAKIWYLKNVQFLLGHHVFIQYLQRIEKCDISTRKSQKFLVSGPWGSGASPPDPRQMTLPLDPAGGTIYYPQTIHLSIQLPLLVPWHSGSNVSTPMAGYLPKNRRGTALQTPKYPPQYLLISQNLTCLDKTLWCFCLDNT